MKFTNNLAAIHGYLCGDGYVIRNPLTQSHKYYHIGFRNTNMVLLRDFQSKFFSEFGIKPIITNDGRCKIQNKKIYYILTKDFSYYSYEWELPKLSKINLKFWLRAFFDCEAWVENQPKKSRLIGLDCCNKKGLFSIKIALKNKGIKSNVKKRQNRKIWRLTICGFKNLVLFQKTIGFNHPNKKKCLLNAIKSYEDYLWSIPEEKKYLFQFIRIKGKARKSRNEIRLFSIKMHNLNKLKKALNRINVESCLFGPWKNNQGSRYYCLIVKEENLK